ncbi:MAG TPA: DUF4919 domain-containing protein [Pyrinomonadaceae bacterium]|jgi:hypothetical protein|nr:DUF4919 domain-containing protein [Pyrinomonadaceae bacterium]
MNLKLTVSAALLVTSFAFPLSASAQKPEQEPPAPAAANQKQHAEDKSKNDAAYDALLKRVKDGDKTVDFKELRMAYADSSHYSPYGGDGDAQKAMFAALNDEKWDEALKQSAKILEENYVDINAHVVADIANRSKGDTEKADFHNFVAKGLIHSITDSGDGKSTDKAFVVISTDEEYTLLNLLGLRPTGQALIKEKGHSFDKLNAVDPKTNDKYEFYFNIDKPFGWLGNSLKH